jgi:signal transduction histidine kinase
VRTLPDDVQVAIWFLCSEALTNIARHSEATSATVNVDVGAGRVAIQIDDDGLGGATYARGLRGLKDRIEALGGSLDLDSPVGGATSLRAVVPLER